MPNELEIKFNEYISRAKERLESINREFLTLSNKSNMGEKLSRAERHKLSSGLKEEKDDVEKAIKEFKALEENIDAIFKEIGLLQSSIRFLSTTDDKDKQNELINTILSAIKELEFSSYVENFNEKTFVSDLKRLVDNSLSKDAKDVIVGKYVGLIKQYNSSLIEGIECKLEDIEDSYMLIQNTTLREQIKTWYDELNEKEKKTLKTTAKILGVSVLLLAIILTSKSCKKDKNEDVEEIKDPFTIELVDTIDVTPAPYIIETESTIDVTPTPHIIDTNVESTAVPTNTPEVVISTPTPTDVSEKEYIPEYENDYEDAIRIYNITQDDAIDFVNRAHKIEATGFFNGASVNDIVEILIAIDNKDLFTKDNANLAQAFNTAFNGVVNNFLFGTNTEEDLKMLEAIQYFATSGSDLDSFLSEFGNLVTAIIKDPNNNEAKDRMYNFINIFATSLNGFTNEDSALTDDENFNNSAQVTDYYDWYIIYTSFVAPLYPTFSTEATFTDFENLQILMISALESPEFNMICGESLTLGGE